MKLVSFERDGVLYPGVLIGGSIVSLDTLAPSLDALIAAWGSLSGQIAGLIGSLTPIPLGEARLRAPLMRPPKIIGVGANYRTAAGEPPRGPIDPILFFKPASSIIGPGDAIILPFEAASVVGETELVIVIGKGGHRIAPETAMAHVFGYTIANDVTAPEVMLGDSDQSPLFFQQGRGKGFPTFCPLGPWIVTSDEIADPMALMLEQRVNDVVQLSGASALMHHDPATLISECSHAFGLEPGDIILSGSPRPPAGAKRVPLQPGDRLDSIIPAIGTLTNGVAESQPSQSRPLRQFGPASAGY